MTFKVEKTVAYWLTGVLFVLGVVCYAAIPPSLPEKPIRIVLKSTAGNVVFDHKIHASEEEYGIDCMDCHHTWEDPDTPPEACSQCHGEEAEEDMPKLSDAFHKQCKDCHEEGGSGPVKCFGCHVL